MWQRLSVIEGCPASPGTLRVYRGESPGPARGGRCGLPVEGSTEAGSWNNRGGCWWREEQ